MAQNVTILGASYSDVPAVTLPKTGGGTASFTDVTPTTITSDSDVANGMIYFRADGSQHTGTNSGSTPNLQTKSKTYTPSTSQQLETITADAGYDGLDEVSITVNAMPTGSAMPPVSIEGLYATASGDSSTQTLTLSQAVNVKPIVSAGYISSGTQRSTNVSLTAGMAVKDATYYHPSTSNQVITSLTYLNGNQTFRAVTTSNLTAENIKNGVTVKIGDSTDDDCVASVTGTYEGGGGGSNWTLIASGTLTVNTTSTSAGSAGTIECGSTAWTANDVIWVHIRGQSGKRNGYFYGSDAIFVNYRAKNGSTSSDSVPAIQYIRVDSGGTYTCATGSYGVYAYSITTGGTLTVRRRYNSTNTLTINDKFDVEVYKLTLPTGKTLFT